MKSSMSEAKFLIYTVSAIFLLMLVRIFQPQLTSFNIIEEKGTTLLKNSIEYGISFILFISLVISLYQYYLEKSEEKLYFALAFVLLLLAELIFTIYHSVFNLDNFLGYVFKVYGFYFILKGISFRKYKNEKTYEEARK